MGTRSRKPSIFVTMWSVKPPSTSMLVVFQRVRASQYSSSGVVNVDPIATDSSLPPYLCLLYALLALLTTFSPFCCLLPPAVLRKVFRDHTQKKSSSRWSLFEVTLHCQCHRTTMCCALMEFLQVFWLCGVCCRIEVFLHKKTLIPHWQINDEQGVKEGLWNCFPASSSLVSKSCR